ncbi:hypothetical protein AM588_10004867 [Phytophthora nicotianae]|uniref:Uncharacterized protein n=1 Tax=Phytophthora nicotianae TaxID=4792 RepID=A0A0W8DEH6_PHYNI|nr:hypothetical protein AM588_10004867 [Phytophthora nicotianae]
MGNAATKAREAHAQAKSKPKNNRSVQQQKLKSAKATGVLALPDSKLKKLPQELLELATLHDNKLTELPAALGRCPKLKVLSARRNTLVGRSAGATVQSIAAELLGEGSAVQVMNLEGNPMTKEDLQGMNGFDAFLTRRTKLKNKEIHGGLNSDLSLCGLE